MSGTEALFDNFIKIGFTKVAICVIIKWSVHWFTVFLLKRNTIALFIRLMYERRNIYGWYCYIG